MANTPLKPDPDNTQISQLEPVQPNPYNLQAVKRYIFNETGNIMLASTELGSETVSDSVRDIFGEVAVFFAAMTKAISTTIDPNSNTPYSVYNYNAIQNVIDGSGLFVHVTEEDVEHNTTSFGATFSKELIEGLLGLATGTGALAFAQGMIASIGSAGLKIGGYGEKSDNKVANIIFICEYLLGMPIVSAMVVSCDAKDNEKAFKAGPCFNTSVKTTHLKMHKDTYMFVTPAFVKKYSGDLEAAADDLEFLEFVDYLQALVRATPIITSVQTMNGRNAPTDLTVGTTYAMTGAFLNNKGQPGMVTVAWVAEEQKKGADLTTDEVQANVITFSPTAMATPSAIGIFFNTGTKDAPIWSLAAQAPITFTAA